MFAEGPVDGTPCASFSHRRARRTSSVSTSSTGGRGTGLESENAGRRLEEKEVVGNWAQRRRGWEGGGEATEAEEDEEEVAEEAEDDDSSSMATSVASSGDSRADESVVAP